MKRKIVYKLVILILITIISILHFITKSNDNTIYRLINILYFAPIIIAAILYGFKGGAITALITSIIYAPHILLSIGLQGETTNELLDVFLFVMIGIVTGILVEKKNIAIQEIDIQLKKYVILENYTNSVLESIHLGIIAVNNDYFITAINTGAKEILGITYNCIGLHFSEAFSCCKEIEKSIIDAIENNISKINLETSIFKDHKEVNIKIDSYPLTLENKNKGLVIIIENITEIKKIINQMHRNDKLAAVGQLATGIAHEIRNPLAIIKMIEQTMCKEFENSPNVLTELKVIDEEVERANKVIKSLMEFSKPNKNEKTILSINQIIEEVLVITNKYLSQHHVKVNFSKNNNSKGIFDKEQLIQVFINLIFNSVDAMPQGGEIHISTKTTLDNKIKIIFEDNGQGITKINLEKIFDPFFTTKVEGTGLGLPITYRIVEDHEGTINVTSIVDKGTIFEIILNSLPEESLPEENSLPKKLSLPEEKIK